MRSLPWATKTVSPSGEHATSKAALVCCGKLRTVLDWRRRDELEKQRDVADDDLAA